MKTTILTTTLLTVLLAASSFGGEVVINKNPTPPSIIYGTGPYIAIQAGANLYQDFGGTRRFDFGDDNELAIDPSENVGFVGGIKLGYVFGTSEIRLALEADIFYNGVHADVDARINGEDTNFSADADLNSVAFLGNVLVKFGTGPFQPYIGGGLGGFYTETDNVEVSFAGRDFTGDGGDNSGFAWQLIAGADWYFNEKTSVFLEYKFLNYEDAGIAQDRISQHIAVLGVRWHF